MTDSTLRQRKGDQPLPQIGQVAVGPEVLKDVAEGFRDAAVIAVVRRDFEDGVRPPRMAGRGMTKIAECGRCGRRLVIWAKGYCKSCYDGARASRELRPEWQRNRSVQPVEILVEQPKPELKPAARVDPAAEAFSRRDLVIMRARAALAVA